LEIHPSKADDGTATNKTAMEPDAVRIDRIGLHGCFGLTAGAARHVDPGIP